MEPELMFSVVAALVGALAAGYSLFKERTAPEAPVEPTPEEEILKEVRTLETLLETEANTAGARDREDIKHLIAEQSKVVSRIRGLAENS